MQVDASPQQAASQRQFASAPRPQWAPSASAANKTAALPTFKPTRDTREERNWRQNYGNKFHRAALDGYVDMLCDASKRDTNLAACDHPLALTPTLVAAQCGQLEALRILVGRGGDPEKVTSHGSSALHLAAGRNHLNCVSFLVNFGVNMWALDNELHTAKDVAAMEQASEVLDYLDQVMAKQSAINTKLVQKLKDKAKREAERRLKQMRKAQMKAIKQVERDERLLIKMSQNRRLLKAAHSMGDIKLVGRGGSCPQSAAAISLSPKCDSGRESPKRLASYIQQQLRGDLLARTRRVRAQLIESSSASIASSSYPSSSVSSTSGYLSSCSAKSILKTAMGRRPSAAHWHQLCDMEAAPSTSRSFSPATSSASVKNKQQERPKYSDLVAVKQAELSDRSSRQTAESPGPGCAGLAAQHQPASSVLASKLRGLGGGVSRKVHLKRLLFITTGGASSKESPPASPLSHRSAGDDDQRTRLKRARSEPDFGAAMRQTELDGDQQEDTDDRKRDSASKCEPDKHHQCHSNRAESSGDSGTTCQQPPHPPPLPPAHETSGGDLRDQQRLLTRCLSQLKIHQETSAHRPPFSHSDELLQHQMKAGEFPLRPSAIKQRHHHFRLAPRPTAGPESATIDSIGSAGSLADKNNDESSSVGSSSSSARSSSCAASGLRSGNQVDRLREFLAAHNLLDLNEVLNREQIDFEALLLLDEQDLRSLDILLGPRKKLLAAIERHQRENSASASQLPPLVVMDTQF